MRKFISSLLFSLYLFGSPSPAPKMQQTGKKPKTYERFDLPWESLHIAAKYLPPNPVIVEAGAFDGRESCTLAQYWPQGKIYSFEPINQLFDLVKTNTQYIHNISIYKLALGSQEGQSIMHLSQQPTWGRDRISMSSSLYEPKEHLRYADTEFTGTEIVNITTLDLWAEKNNISHIDMLWLDMQGYELPAMKSSPNILKTVSVILTELEFCEAYAGQPLYQEVRAWLEEQGFVLIAGNFNFPKDRNQWFGDGMFVRKHLTQ